MAGLFGSWLIMERVLGLEPGDKHSSSGTSNSCCMTFFICKLGERILVSKSFNEDPMKQSL